LEVKGRGLMMGLGLSFEPSLLVPLLMQKGLITVGAASQTLRLLPPLTVNQEEIHCALSIIRDCLGKVELA